LNRRVQEFLSLSGADGDDGQMTDPKVTFMAIAEGLEPLEHAIIMTSCPQLSATQNVPGNMLPPMAV